jgi:nucleoside-diphosphate-sugar epimerase
MTEETILVTGAAGGLGSLVVQELLANGYNVVGADRVAPREAPARIVETDLTDPGQVAYAAKGASGIIHLGAIPSPYRHPDDVLFRNNTGATFAVFQAASLLGITSVVFASSISGYGMSWSPTYFNPIYLPVDETHPMRNHDAYGLSKEVDEHIAQMFVRKDGMSVAAMRFHWIGPKAQILARGGQPAEPHELRQLFGYVERHDAARACRLALMATREHRFDFEAFNIVAADTLVGEPTEDLIRRMGPDIEIRKPIAGFGGGFDISKARALLGWEPQWSWRTGDPND